MLSGRLPRAVLKPERSGGRKYLAFLCISRRFAALQSDHCRSVTPNELFVMTAHVDIRSFLLSDDRSNQTNQKNPTNRVALDGVIQPQQYAFVCRGFLRLFINIELWRLNKHLAQVSTFGRDQRIPLFRRRESCPNKLFDRRTSNKVAFNRTSPKVPRAREKQAGLSKPAHKMKIISISRVRKTSIKLPQISAAVTNHATCGVITKRPRMTRLSRVFDRTDVDTESLAHANGEKWPFVRFVHYL